MKTVVAISTAPGNAGIGIVRLTGKESFEVIKKIFKAKNSSKIKGYQMKYGYILDSKGDVVDEVLVSYFVSPKSYTGENMCEINSHGNNLVLKKILELCIENGAKIAEPGEFTKRAYLNGRIDLSQAEAVIELINSKSELERKNAIKNLEGELSKDVKKIKKDILEILSNIEVSIDYPEYDIEETANEKIKKNTLTIIESLKKLERTFENGKILRDGVSIAIVGRPNAGKSSLLNKILREERAIVTDIEGTTRDTIEEYINIRGIPFKIIDTAGIRDSNNAIEKIGIEKSKEVLKQADVVLAIFDITKKLEKEDYEILEEIKEKKTIILLNKKDLKERKLEIDVIKKYKKDNILEISVKEDNVEIIYDKLEEMFNIDKIDLENNSIITNLRHKKAIVEAENSLVQAINTIKNQIPIDITAIYFKEAIDEINKITGENVNEDIINDIFSKFCLGK